MKKEKVSLIIGLSLPILMIILVSLSIYLPKIFSEKPEYDFLYIENLSFGDFIYQVKNNTLVEINRKENLPKRKPSENTPGPVAKIYIHDVSINQSREIDFSEAEKLKLDSSNKSPDGFEIVFGARNGGFPFLFFNSGNYETKYIRNNLFSQKLNLAPSRYYDFQFLGWIIE